MDKTYDIYENKNLTAEDMRKMYAGITGLDNADDFTPEELHAYLVETMSEKNSREYTYPAKSKYADQVNQYVELMKKHPGSETATIPLSNMRRIEVYTDKDAVIKGINRYTVKICSNNDERYNDKSLNGKDFLDEYSAVGSSLDVVAPLLESAFRYNEYYPPFLHSTEQSDHKKYPCIFKHLSDSHKFFKYCNEGVLSVVEKFLWDFYETNKIELDEESNNFYYVSGEDFPSIINEYVSGCSYTTEEFIAQMMFPEKVKFQSFWEERFDDFLEMIDFQLVKNENEYNEETDEYGVWSLKDITEANWGNIEGDRFNDAAGIFERLDRYVYDSVIRELYDEYGIDSDKYNTWADIVADSNNIIKELGKNRRNVCTYLDYLDLVCNHAGKINLEHCKHIQAGPELNVTNSLSDKINDAQTRKNEQENDINNIETFLEK